MNLSFLSPLSKGITLLFPTVLFLSGIAIGTQHETLTNTFFPKQNFPLVYGEDSYSKNTVCPPYQFTPLPSLESDTQPSQEVQCVTEPIPSPTSLPHILPSHVFDGVKTQRLNHVYSLLKKHYIDPEEITSEKLEEWLIRGILYSVEDPYTDFLNEEQSEDFKEGMEGDFEGVGIALEKRKGRLYITEVFKKLPAAKAGMLPGDIIIAVDGLSVKDETIWETILRIRGEKGTEVEIEVLRNGSTISMPVIRDKIHVESVNIEFVGKEENIAYIEVTQFGDTLQSEFKKAFEAVQQNNPKAIIMDMRYNGGGYMYGAVELASYFLPAKSKVLQIKTRNGIEENLYTDRRNTRDEETPLIILINGGTASSAEIFTLALTEHGRATTLGEKSFGKGVVQQMFPLGLTTGEFVKITISAWLTPNGVQVSHEAPIIPDVEVEWDRLEMTEEQFLDNWDPQKQRAIEILDTK